MVLARFFQTGSFFVRAVFVSARKALIS